jgi:hypothetical protein
LVGKRTCDIQINEIFVEMIDFLIDRMEEMKKREFQAINARMKEETKNERILQRKKLKN